MSFLFLSPLSLSLSYNKDRAIRNDCNFVYCFRVRFDPLLSIDLYYIRVERTTNVTRIGSDKKNNLCAAAVVDEKPSILLFSIADRKTMENYNKTFERECNR